MSRLLRFRSRFSATVALLMAGYGCSPSTPSGPNGSSGGAPGAGGAGSSGAGNASGRSSNGGSNSAAAGSAVVTSSAGASAGTAGQASGLGGATSGGASAAGATAGAASAGAGAATGGGTGTVTVQLAQTKQTMEGFGINDVFQPAIPADYLNQLFGTDEKGIGLSILRIGMHWDGTIQNGSDAVADITAAKNLGVKTFIASAWSAGASCKTNNDTTGGGHLKTGDCYQTWANTIAAFPAKVKSAAGVDLYAMSPANEPDFASCGYQKPCNGNYDTMLYTDVEATNFVNVVGPLLHGLNPPVKVMTPEASEWVHLWSNMSAAGSTDPLKGAGYDYGHGFAKDSKAWGVIDIVGVHQYDTQLAFPWPSEVTPTKPIFMTEMSGVKYWPEEGPSSDIGNGLAVAGWIHDAIVNGPASAWVWWWPRPLKDGTDDNEGLWLKDGTKTRRMYTLGNYSKFIRPGYTRVDISGAVSKDVLLTAYKAATDGTVVIVAVNKSSASLSLPIAIAGGTAPASLTPYVTSASDDLKAGTAVAVSAGSFSATLAGQTVTTFVGK